MKNIEKLLHSRSVRLRNLANDGYLRTGHYTGSGRHTKSVSCMDEVTAQLRGLNIGYATGNDAPRGGVTGEFIVLTSREQIKGKKEAQKLLKKATYTWKKRTRAELAARAREIAQREEEKKREEEERERKYREWDEKRRQEREQFLRDNPPLTEDELRQYAIDAISWCDETAESDEPCWKSVFQDNGVYRLIVADGRIRGAIKGGYGLSMPKVEHRSCGYFHWVAAIERVVWERFPKAKMLKADYADAKLYMRSVFDGFLIKTRPVNRCDRASEILSSLSGIIPCQELEN